MEILITIIVILVTIAAVWLFAWLQGRKIDQPKGGEYPEE